MILKKKKDQNQKVKSELSEYHFNNDKIIHGNPPLLQDIIMQQSKGY